MKDIKRLFWFVGCLLLTTTLFSSCLGDADGIVDLDNSQRTKWVNNACGKYFGYVSIENSDGENTEQGTLNFEIKSDSTFTCTDFPIKLLTSYIDQDPYKQILKSSGVQTFNGSIHPYYGGYDQYYSYYFFPNSDALSFTTNYNDFSYKVSVKFATSLSETDSEGYEEAVYPIALKNILSDILTANILIESVTVNYVEFQVNKIMTLQGYPTSRYSIETAN